ncbi:MAG: type III-B CRISPR module RAMP protein Cmr6, partial [Thiomargarita sp.]|nr:type III-B CRISPR module RAMP protein Cmr6 [Thiomargarita sp.]
MNRIPLYDEEEKYSDNRILQYFHEDSSHLGLWFTRFFNQYDARWQVNKENHANEQEEGKKAWINLTAKKEIDKEINNETSVNRKCGDDKALSEYQFRMLNLLKSLKGKKDQELNSDDFAICETNWNFVTGMGLPHPVENGMSWHHSLGVPYLAGSSIKGLLRAWVEGGWDEESDRKKRAKRRQKWFGMVKGEKWDNEGEEKDDKDQVGQLIFFDAVPIAPVELIPDIMTPHYGQWYAEGNKITSLSESEKIPADWHDPVP